jgi:trk system potassium uptake protein TrkA
MRIVIIGAGSLTVAAAEQFIEHGHDVVIVEKDEARVETLGETIDCSFVIGDGSRPSILKEVGPRNTDYLFCLTEDDQDNIIASLVGRSLGFGRVVTSIRDIEFEPIVTELGLESPIFLDATISQRLSDMVQGIETAGLSGVLRGGLRFFALSVGEDQAGRLVGTTPPAPKATTTRKATADARAVSRAGRSPRGPHRTRAPIRSGNWARSAPPCSAHRHHR